MDYQRPDALQRVCEEIERTVWPSDRKFFRKHPKRSYRLRPALAVEVAERELVDGVSMPCPPGMGVFVSVRQLAPGLRLRLLFVAPVVEPWVDLPEEFCRTWYDRLYQNNPRAQEIAHGFEQIAKTASARFDLSRENDR